MPGLDGAALHAHLSERTPEAARRMAFTTGGALTERVQAFAAAQPEILRKPFTARALVDFLYDALARIEAGAPR